MNDRLIIHDDADKTPPASPGRHPLAPISGADFPRRSSPRLPAQAWIILTLVCVLPVLLLLWGAYSAVQSLLLDAPWLSSLMGALLLLLAAVGLVGLVGTLAARGWVSVQQARVIRTAHGAPLVPVVWRSGVAEQSRPPYGHMPEEALIAEDLTDDQRRTAGPAHAPVRPEGHVCIEVCGGDRQPARRAPH